ncbi:TetR/AcrR family transcriptional regulator [Salinibacterium sp. SYSU T00001]|uniref:TetR/AcrR family transcriptional regulator n=1 Tax=Homoserinimonas sedimenticola TaxID=2986805 RepID=UPI002236B2AA|nr:TetR/AcrR family transcriptional regulator [Salinibacterium sedimenticola]MCW4385194.1 TetR/AcrR family transcriptional regulator [Salinibacterium sedimenticola]
MTTETPAPKVTRRDELVQVALTVLERDGFAHLSVGEVARLAGIKPPSLYKQFAGKADIEVALIAHGLDLLAGEFELCLDETPADATYRDRLAGFMQCFRSFGLEHPQLYLLMNSRPYPTEQLGPAAEHSAARIFWRTVAEGDTSRAAGEVVASAWAWAHGILSLEIVGRLESADASWALLVDTVSAQPVAR